MTHKLKMDYNSYCKYLLQGLFTSDNLFIKALLAGWMFFSGIHAYLLAIPVFIMLDVISGVFASYRKGLPVTSKKLRKGLLEKISLYMILVIAGFFLDYILKTVFPWESYYVVFLISILISSYELVSIFENLQTLNPKLRFLASLIALSKKVNDKALKIAERKIDEADITTEQKTLELPDEQKN